MRNSKEEFVVTYAKYYGIHMSLWTEAKAILDGLARESLIVTFGLK